MAEERCREIADRLAEPLLATATHELGWILLEHPAAWGRNALLESGLEPAFAEALDARAKRLGLRVLLIRQPGRRDVSAGRACFLVHGGEGRASIEAATVADPADLLAADLEALARGEPTGLGRAHEGALHLVCTHGKRDACCALHGAPVARALAAARPATTWECSHVGGHRFAANVVSFPDALLFGRVLPGEAVDVAAAYEAGRVSLDHFRGRCSHAEPVQAADGLVRRELGLDGIGDVALAGVPRVEEDGSAIEAEVRLRVPDGELVARVRGVPGEPRPASCGAAKLERPVAWALASLSRG
ncbi:MAG: sucrase ferredoxin [Thermoleophilia bacterium]